MKIVKVGHVDYELKIKSSDRFYFKTDDDVEINDFVWCDTINGLMVGKVTKVFETLDEAFELKDLPALNGIKRCSKLNLLEE